MTIASNYPSIRPSLLLDFANTKQLDPRITFSRASTGAYYDGKTVVKAEENLLLQSQSFDVTWAPSLAVVTANTGDTTAPDGTSTAEKLENDTSAGLHLVFQAVTLNGTSYTFSVYAKKGTANFVALRGSDGSTARNVWFNLDTGAVGTVDTNITASIVSVGNGWYRCIGTWTGSSASSSNYSVAISESNGVLSYTGTTKNIYIWGAQLEQRSTVTAYTPTTTAPITNYIPSLQTAAANGARFDHDPITGESKGLLIEEQRTNLVTYSEQFNDVTWIKTNATVTANAVVAPDGTLTGDKLVEDTTASNTHVINTSFSATSGSTYTTSIFVKAGERTECSLQLASAFATATSIRVNLTNGSVINTSGSPVAAGVTPVGNGWYRIYVAQTANATTTALVLVYASNGGTTVYTGNGYSGIYIWGAQLEAGAFPTSYIPTVASQVTRSADSASMTGTNFSSWYRADEGTLYANVQRQYAVPANTYPSNFSISDGGFTNFIFNAYVTTNVGGFSVAANSVSQTDLFPTATSALSRKMVGAYKTNDFAACLDGGTVSTDASGIIPVVNTAYIGANQNGAGGFLNGTIKRIAYYPKRLSNTELQGLTS